MKSHLIIVSQLIEKQIEEEQPDIQFFIFRSLKELADYIDVSPIRADKMILTKDALGDSINTSLHFLLNQLANPFLTVTSIEYITEKDSPDLASVEYLIHEIGLENWKVKLGSLTRDYVYSYINGTLSTEDAEPNKFVIYRMKKTDYLKQEMQRKNAELEKRYESEDKKIEEVGKDIKVPEFLIREDDDICQIIRIAGNNCMEKDVFTFIMGQYLAFNGKTLLIEKDFHFLTLTDIAFRSEVEFEYIDVDMLYKDSEQVKRTIRNTRCKLILIGSKHKRDYNYSYICSFLYSNLKNDLDFLITEHNVMEMVTDINYIVVLPNRLVDILKFVEALPTNFSINNTYVGIETSTISELSLQNTQIIKVILSDLLQIDLPEIPIIGLSSLKLGGSAHDLRMLIKTSY